MSSGVDLKLEQGCQKPIARKIQIRIKSNAIDKSSVTIVEMPLFSADSDRTWFGFDGAYLPFLRPSKTMHTATMEL
ncbi:hypothetical protein C0081_13100 [Cohaesibacter celericrescens]|uniref:Uncharacterized protein n=1 Tax=Cohaesibacter celericrescens TaxID=2067669 RepID=A0A2N5XR27_9HYPH|nr:hypothetical protein C0081_13100 [Cohaesibacter celericrescens]